MGEKVILSWSGGKDSALAFFELRQAGYEVAALLTTVDTKLLDKEFAGREFDADFVAELPDRVDPCGENGEFHTFVYDGPVFNEKVGFVKGQKVLRDNRYFFCDLILYE